MSFTTVEDFINNQYTKKKYCPKIAMDCNKGEILRLEAEKSMYESLILQTKSELEIEKYMLRIKHIEESIKDFQLILKELDPKSYKKAHKSAEDSMQCFKKSKTYKNKNHSPKPDSEPYDRKKSHDELKKLVLAYK